MRKRAKDRQSDPEERGNTRTKKREKRREMTEKSIGDGSPHKHLGVCDHEVPAMLVSQEKTQENERKKTTSFLLFFFLFFF